MLALGRSTTSWTRYRNGWAELKNSVQHGAPSLGRDQAGLWTVTRIGDITAVLVKSKLHPSTDGPALPIRRKLILLSRCDRPRLDHVQPCCERG